MKILIILVALAVFQLPLYLVKELTAERSQRCVGVQNEIAGCWGGKQEISFVKSAGVAWKTLDVSAKIIPEIRYRGIYQAAVYTAEINIKATFIPRCDNNIGGIWISDCKAITEVTGKIDGKFGQQSVVAMQKFLASLGLYKGKLDGYMGGQTVLAWQKYINSRL